MNKWLWLLKQILFIEFHFIKLLPCYSYNSLVESLAIIKHSKHPILFHNTIGSQIYTYKLSTYCPLLSPSNCHSANRRAASLSTTVQLRSRAEMSNCLWEMSGGHWQRWQRWCSPESLPIIVASPKMLSSIKADS